MNKELSKKCNKCNETKPLSEFSHKKTSKDKYAHACKMCNNKLRRQRYEKNKDNVLKKNKEWIEKNKEWREKNKEHIKQKKRQWYSENREEQINHYKENRSEILEKKSNSNFKTALLSIGSGTYYKRWSSEEDINLLFMKNEGMTFKQISLGLKRSLAACVGRARKLAEGKL